MRSIGSVSLAGSRLGFAALALVLLAAGANPAKRPRYGGTLRVEFPTGAPSLDPREWKPGAAEASARRLALLVFDRLVAVDNYGRVEPQLATEWSHDAADRRWKFVVRSGVKFSDGTPLAPADVVASLESLLPAGMTVSLSGTSVVVQSATGAPDLLEQLASGPYFVFRTRSDKSLVGSGPFYLADAAPAKPRETPGAALQRMRFKANPGHWAGRPYLDEVEVTCGVLPLRALVDLQLGKADVVELSPELERRAAQAKLRTWTSLPLTLYGLRFEPGQAGAAERREALELALDRATMANVLLQRQAEPAPALLPQWLSGYAFLFMMETNLERAKALRSSWGGKAAEPLRLQVDAPGDTAKLLGERVAVNARQAGMAVEVSSKFPARGTIAAGRPETKTAVHLFAWRYESLSCRAELAALARLAGQKDAAEPGDADEVYAREKRMLEERQIVPLVVFPDYVGLGPEVRDWMPARWGEWHLADLWLERPGAAADEAGPLSPSGAGEHP